MFQWEGQNRCVRDESGVVRPYKERRWQGSRSGPGRKERETRRYARLRPPGRLLGAPPEEAEDDAGRDPIVVLMSVRAERGAVIIGIEQTDVNVPEWMDVQPSADFIRETVLRSVVSAAPADLGVRARSPDQRFCKRS